MEAEECDHLAHGWQASDRPLKNIARKVGKDGRKGSWTLKAGTQAEVGLARGGGDFSATEGVLGEHCHGRPCSHPGGLRRGLEGLRAGGNLLEYSTWGLGRAPQIRLRGGRITFSGSTASQDPPFLPLRESGDAQLEPTLDEGDRKSLKDIAFLYNGLYLLTRGRGCSGEKDESPGER